MGGPVHAGRPTWREVVQRQYGGWQREIDRGMIKLRQEDEVQEHNCDVASKCADDCERQWQKRERKAKKQKRESTNAPARQATGASAHAKVR
jgi:uncharacterized protein YifE (UPF0438 family)